MDQPIRVSYGFLAVKTLSTNDKSRDVPALGFLNHWRNVFNELHT